MDNAHPEYHQSSKNGHGSGTALFFPTERDMKVEYPELTEIEEFEKLKGSELKFVWFWANRTSPYYSMKHEKIKVQACIRDAFGDSLTGDEYKRYLSCNFAEHILIAIDKMEKFSPSTRLRAKMTIEKIFTNLEKITDIEKTDLIDLQSRKEYANLAVTVSKNMGDIVKQMENAFGIRYHNSEEKEEKGPTMMDRLHMEDDS